MTKDGTEIFNEKRVYMPTPQQMGRGDKMGRGPYEKSGIVEDTSLPPGKAVEERFDIFYPTEDTLDDSGRTVRNVLEDEVEVQVQLWYLPFGTMRTTPYLWQEATRTVTLK